MTLLLVCLLFSQTVLFFLSLGWVHEFGFKAGVTATLEAFAEQGVRIKMQLKPHQKPAKN